VQLRNEREAQGRLLHDLVTRAQAGA